MNARIALVALSLIATQSRAAELPDLAPAFAAHRYADIERQARGRLSESPRDPAALLALGRLIVETDDLARFKEAEDRLTQCIERQPDLAACHLWLARVHGKQIDGMFSALRLAPKSRAEFERAVELDPSDLDAVAGLVEFYVAAPAAVGGGKDKAAALQARAEQRDPEGGRLLRVFLLLGDDKLAEAEQTLMDSAAAPGGPGQPVVRAYLHQRVGGAYLRAKRPADALRVLRAGAQRFPDEPALWLGVGRASLELGRPDEAIAALERSLARQPVAAAHLRLGEAWAAKGDTARATAALERALSFVPALPTALREDAERRLKGMRAGG